MSSCSGNCSSCGETCSDRTAEKLGREYAGILEDEVVRLCLSLELGVEEQTLRSAAAKMAPEELRKFKSALERQAARRYPVQLQLGGREPEEDLEGSYLI